MNKTEQESRQALAGVAANVQASSTLGQQTLQEELLTGTNLTTKMQADKVKFIKQHMIKKSQSEALEVAAAASSKKGLDTIVSIPRKRSDGSGDDDELVALE